MTKSKSKLAIAILPGPGPADAHAPAGEGSNPPTDLGESAHQSGDGVGQLCLPQDVVATADDRDRKVAPEPGDDVRFDCVAKVNKVENGNIYLTPTEVNGTPVGDPNSDGPGMEQGPDADNEQSMRDLAQRADDGAGVRN